MDKGLITNNYYRDSYKIQKDINNISEGTAGSRKSHRRSKSGRETKKAEMYLKSLLKDESMVVMPT